MSFAKFAHQTFTPTGWANEESYDPQSGAYRRSSRPTGMAVSVNPHSAAFGNSMGVMNGLGGLIGGAFGQANAMNLMSAEKDRDRAHMASMLRAMLGGMNMGGQGGGYGDTMSRQRSGGGGGQMSSMIRGGFYGRGY